MTIDTGAFSLAAAPLIRAAQGEISERSVLTAKGARRRLDTTAVASGRETHTTRYWLDGLAYVHTQVPPSCEVSVVEGKPLDELLDLVLKLIEAGVIVRKTERIHPDPCRKFVHG